MDIHPILVHFPIALLTVYSIMELLRFSRLNKSDIWFYLKSFIVVLGTLGSYAAYAVGDTASHLLRQTHPELSYIVRIHETWASMTLVIFTVISGIYLIEFFKKINFGQYLKQGSFVDRMWHLKMKVGDFFYKPSIMITLALAGLVAVTITGAFGGSLIYGSSSDPMVALVYKIFVVSL